MTTKVPSSVLNCWNCDKRGIPGTGSSWKCPECEVMWWPYTMSANTLPDRIVYCGVVLEVVDFEDPATLSSPA